jgi:hypothetical protein
MRFSESARYRDHGVDKHRHQRAGKEIRNFKPIYKVRASEYNAYIQREVDQPEREASQWKRQYPEDRPYYEIDHAEEQARRERVIEIRRAYARYNTYT